MKILTITNYNYNSKYKQNEFYKTNTILYFKEKWIGTEFKEAKTSEKEFDSLSSSL
jgi:hypothetical protein